jgi:hypothetical protein
MKSYISDTEENRTEMKETKLQELFRCDCNDPSHELVILADQIDELSPRVYVTVRLKKNISFFKLINIARKYVFGMRSVYGDFDEVTLKPEYSDELQKVIDVLIQIREKEGRQTSDESNDLKVEGDFQELFICECKDPSHQFIVRGYDFKDEKEVYMSIFLSRDHSIFHRIWTAIKYLFGCHFTYEQFGDTIIDLKDTDRIQAIVDYLKKLQEENVQADK